jgi:hypothetical protein
LLKHTHNPVHWREWNEETLAQAKKLDRLIFLSIGYTACHWCNELERECFIHDDFAAEINGRFISVKVDREERPDLDQLYMQAAMVMGGGGGWPNNVILTPDLDPIYSLGYQKRPVFINILGKLDELWRTDRGRAIRSGESVRETLNKLSSPQSGTYSLAAIDTVRLKTMQNGVTGGFGGGQKFPMTSVLELYLNDQLDDDFFHLTLMMMARRGLYDHVGGGFHRYTVDDEWAVPHFEKMLYDNATLISLFARGSVMFDNEEYRQTVRQSVAFVVRELTDTATGGFFSSLDADSGGVEGAFYTWSLQEIFDAGINDPHQFAELYSVTAEGNVDEIEYGVNGPHSIKTGRSTLIRHSSAIDTEELLKLFAIRQLRERPPLDDKVIGAWHGLMVSALVDAAIALEEPEYLAAAIRGGLFLHDTLGDHHFWRPGFEAMGERNLDDCTFTAGAYYDLYTATGDPIWLEHSIATIDIAILRFTDGEGGYYLTAARRDLIARPRTVEDNPIPSGSARLGRILWRLGVITGDDQRIESARAAAKSLMARLNGPSVHGGEATILAREVAAESVEVVISFPPQESHRLAWLKAATVRRWGIIVVPLGSPLLSPGLTEGRSPKEQTMAYVCQGRACLEPATSPDELRALLTSL